METRIGSRCQVPIPTSTTTVAGIKPSDSGLSSRFFAPKLPAGLLFAFLSVLLFPSSLQTLLSLPLSSKPLCLPPPPPLTEPCPRLTLPGLNRCRCPFGLGTAGAAAARRPPLPPFTACPPPPAWTRHVFLIVSAVSSYFNGSTFTFFTSGDASFPVFLPRSLRGGRRYGALLNYTTGSKKNKKKNYVSHFRAGQRSVHKRTPVLLSGQLDVTDRWRPGNGGRLPAADWALPWQSLCWRQISRNERVNQRLLLRGVRRGSDDSANATGVETSQTIHPPTA